MDTDQTLFLPRAKLQTLIASLLGQAYEVIAPVVDQGAILYRPIQHSDELPLGAQDDQAPGHYRVTSRESPRLFAWANGPQALKPLVFAAREVLWTTEQDEQGRMRFNAVRETPKKRAVFGVRACDLAALALTDQHFLAAEADSAYQARRQSLVLIAVNCSHPADTCFCSSTNDGPACSSGYDLLLDELDDGFLLRLGSPTLEVTVDQLGLKAASATQLEEARAQLQQAVECQKRSLPNVHQQLRQRLEHDHWQDVAERCLACGNCTSVCPTCFCHNETEVPAFDGRSSQHVRQWDSCFTSEHSYIHGFLVRRETRFRYRQWLSHKLDYWHDQYGRSGCVGCGRCISWCPEGIDLTEEVAGLLKEAQK